MTRDTNILVAIEAFYVLSTGVFKASLGFFFLRVLVNRRLRKVTYAVLIATCTYSFAYFFTVVWHCGTPSGNNFWVKTFQYQCMTDTTQKGLTYTHAVVTAGSDLYFLLLVPFIVGNTKLRFKEKINIAVLLGLATFGFVASLVRIKYIPIVLTHGLDFFHRSLLLAIWSAAEPGFGIISSSLATLRPLMKDINSHIKSMSKSKDSYAGGSTTLANKTGETSKNSQPEIEYEDEKDIEKQQVEPPRKPFKNLRTFFNTGTQLSTMQNGTNMSAESLTRRSFEDIPLQRPSNVFTAPTIASNESTSPWTSYVNVGHQRTVQEQRAQTSWAARMHRAEQQVATRRPTSATNRDGLSLGIFSVMNSDRQRRRGRNP
jgi:hypothetical protein